MPLIQLNLQAVPKVEEPNTVAVPLEITAVDPKPLKAIPAFP